MYRVIALAMTLLVGMVPIQCSDNGNRTCPGWEFVLEANQPQNGWDVQHMSNIMWRESRCQHTAYNARGHASGLLQITPVSYPYLRDALGEWVDRWTLLDPIQNVRAAAALYDYWANAGSSGYHPWQL